jgi:beta-glucanase (GH16 family)
MYKFISSLFFIFSISLFAQEKVEDDFEGNGTITTWAQDASVINTSFSNPFKTGINTSNTVLRYEDNGGQYANVRFDVPKNFDLSQKHTFTLKIYVPSNNITGNQTNQISLKLQNNKINAPWSTQSEVIKTISLNTWQTVTFDFKNDPFVNLDSNSPIPTNRTDFNRVLLQVNGENNTDRVTAYIDDFSYDGTLPESNNNNSDINFDTLVWSDEFDGNGAVDATKWHHQTQIPTGGNWYNNEVQHYTNKISNSYVSNSTLKIKAIKESFTDQGVTKNYTSARLNSKYAFKYGKAEIRAKLPSVAGTWPAIWLLGKNINEDGGFWDNQGFGTTNWPFCGEIDIMEPNIPKTEILATWHWNNGSGYKYNSKGIATTNANTSQNFHLYTLIWNETSMKIYMNDILINEMETVNPFNQEYYFLLNIAMGGNLGGAIDPNFNNDIMEIDYVRVYQASSLSSDDTTIDEKKIRIFPNPVNDQLEIQFANFSEKYQGTIYDLTGKRVHTFHKNAHENSIDVSFLKSGFYILNIQSDSFSKNFKILKN